MKNHIQSNPVEFPIFFSILSWILTVFFSVFYFFLGVCIGLPWTVFVEKKSGRSMHAIARMWAWSIIAASGFWKVRVENKENIRPEKHYVVIANHQSILDILAVLAILPLHFKFVAKKELFSIPFIGWHMALSGYIGLARNDPASRRKAFAQALECLKKSVSVLFFPEGTRSLTGEIQKFKPGAFRAAQELDLEILPVVIHGTGDAIPKNTFLIRKKSTFVVSVGKAFRIAPDEDLNTVMESCRMEMSRRLEEIRK